jgi:hypothetical protein
MMVHEMAARLVGCAVLVLLTAGCSSKTKDTGAGNTGTPSEGTTNAAGNGNSGRANTMDSWERVKEQAGDRAEVGEVHQVIVAGFEFFYVTTAAGNDIATGYAVAVRATPPAMLRGADAMRAVLDTGFQDAAGLATLAVLFLQGGGAVVTAPTADERAAGVTAPSISGNQLTYWYETADGMSQDLSHSRVDLTTFSFRP